MKKPQIPLNEKKRQRALDAFGILDTSPEPTLDDITLLASQICGVPVALISLVDHNRQWFKSSRGLSVSETPREFSFCGHAINESDVFIVEDATLDERFSDNPFVTGDLHLRFYAGAQLTTSDGFNIGTLCVIDRKARKLNADQINALRALSRQVISNFERRRFAERLRVRSKFLSSVLDILPFRVSYLDQNMVYCYVNPATEKWVGKHAEQILGHTVQEIYGDKVVAAVDSYVRKALTGEPQMFQSRIAYPEKGPDVVRDLRTYCVPDKKEGGLVPGVFIVVEDLTEQFETQRLLRAKEVELQRIFDELPVQVSRWDRNLNNVHVNRSFALAIGKDPQQLKGKNLQEIIGALDLESCREQIQEVLQGHPQTLETSKTLAGGSIKYSLVNYIPEFKDNLVCGFILVETDISEAKRLENERRFLESRIINSSKMAGLGEMAGGVAHEINNPLAIIKGKADQLINRLNDGDIDVTKFREDLLKIETTVDRIAKIVRGLKSFSRSGENDPMTMTSISDIVSETLDLCRQRFKNEGIDIRYMASESPRIECRSVQISQVLMNLLLNAFDAVVGTSVKWVSIEILTSEKSLQVRVTDSGLGIQQAVASKIMSPFFTTKAIGKGTGLGLSIAKGIAEDHGGTLRYEAESPNTLFVLELPLRQVKPLKKVS